MERENSILGRLATKLSPRGGGGGIPYDGDGIIVIYLFDLTYGGHKGNLVFSLGVKLK